MGVGAQVLPPIRFLPVPTGAALAKSVPVAGDLFSNRFISVPELSVHAPPVTVFAPNRKFPERFDLSWVNPLFRDSRQSAKVSTSTPDPLVERIRDFVMALPVGFGEAELIELFWSTGNALRERVRDTFGALPVVDEFAARIKQDLGSLGETRIENGPFILDYFAPEELQKMIRLAHAFPQTYVQRLLTRLNLQKEIWGMFLELSNINDPYERFFYAEMCFHDQWTLTRLRKEIKQNRFHTYTVSRQSDQRLRESLLELARGDRRQWVYRDLVRFDFLNLALDDFDKMKEPDFENLMIQNVMAILEEFGSGFRLEDKQRILRYRDPDDTTGKVLEIRLDLLMNVEETDDRRGAYPLIVELKKVPFGKAVLEQCELYRKVFELKDESGPLFNKTGRPARVMAFVPKANADYIQNIMRLGLYGDQNISPIFVSVYTYAKPDAEFLNKVIGVQLVSSRVRADAFLAKLGQADLKPGGRERLEGRWLYSSLFFMDAGEGDEPEVLPF